jgi:A/G-specific adenine glycosylase
MSHCAGVIESVSTTDPAVASLIAWFSDQGADFPWRQSRDRYAVLVAEVQLQSTQVARVVPYFERWMARWPTVDALASAPLAEVLSAWQGLGYPRRARNLHRAAQMICTEGWPPADRLTDLPGVGPYTAAAVRCFADEESVLPIDVNVGRVLARRFPDGWPGTPDGHGWTIGQALMDVGREWCTQRAPRCASGCPLRDGCGAAESGQPEQLAPARRRQSAFAGSMRQRRGVLMRAMTSDGSVPIAHDIDAAMSLVADGLAREDGDLLLLPVD